MPATFEFFRFRFHFRAVTPTRFPLGKAANAIRGALGLALREVAPPEGFQELFRPEGGRAPSGFADLPRPFVIRAAHLDGVALPAETPFCWDFHAFDLRHPPLDFLRQALARLAEEGIGPSRGRASLERIEQLDLLDRAQPLGDPDDSPAPLAVSLEPGPPAAWVRLRFLTPTELKGEGTLAERPEFGILFSRLRDRIASLCALYGRGPLSIDFSGLGERARNIRLMDCDLKWSRPLRRSSRTGQVHEIGGFTGDAVYEGDLGEFVPWLEAARWTGVGRQTVWGKGDVRVIRAS